MGKEAGKEEGKGNGVGCSPEKHTPWVLRLEACLSLVKAGVLGQVSGEGFSRVYTISPGVAFQGHGLLLLVSDGAGDFCHYSWSWS